jgi:hypothetical protein
VLHSRNTPPDIRELSDLTIRTEIKPKKSKNIPTRGIDEEVHPLGEFLGVAEALD